MGFFQDIVKRAAGPIIDSAVAEQMLAIQKSTGAQAPAAMEVPAIMQVGGMFNAGVKKKYGGVIDFDTLRQFSVVYDVARACINHRKRQIANLEWSIVPKDEKAPPGTLAKDAATITAFFEEPSHGNDFKMFTDKLLEDLLVFDAGVLWKDKTYGGQLKEMITVDGATIRIKISPDGTLPEPPQVAYQQIINGELRGEYTTDEMYYKIVNPRNNTPYGLGPLEALVIAVDSALRSQLYNANMLSEGAVPEGFFGVPSDWSPDQIKDYQLWFDTMIAGNGMYSSRIKFMPGGKGVGYIPTKKAEDMRYLEFEKWLLLKTCAMFDVQPSDIGFMDDMGNNSGASQQELGNQRGLVPTANFLKSIYSEIIRKDFNQPLLKFEWKGLQVVDNEFELERSKMMIESGALTINEMRIEQGREPFSDDVANKPMIFTAGGPVLLEVVAHEATQAVLPKEVVPEGGAPAEGDPAAPAAKDPKEDDTGKATLEEIDLQKWETKVINFIKKGKVAPAFKSEAIPRAVQNLIGARLMLAKSREEVMAAFKPFRADAMERSLIERALKLRGDMSTHQRARYESAGS